MEQIWNKDYLMPTEQVSISIETGVFQEWSTTITEGAIVLGLSLRLTNQHEHYIYFK